MGLRFLANLRCLFRPIFAFFVIDINSKRVVHVGVTRSPTAEWTAQQLRNITPFGEGPQFIIRDNDNKFGARFDRVAKGAGMKVLRTAVQAPPMNSICERFLGSVRRGRYLSLAGFTMITRWPHDNADRRKSQDRDAFPSIHTMRGARYQRKSLPDCCSGLSRCSLFFQYPCSP